MKKILVISTVAALGLSAAALAGGLPEAMPLAPTSSSDMGVYFGLQGGYGVTNWKNLDQSEDAFGKGSVIEGVSKDNGFVSRVFVGADLSRYLAVEFGYTWFFNKPKLNIAGEGENVLKLKNTMVLDLMGKVKAPVVDGFDLYGKLGVNYSMSRINNNDIDLSTIRNFNVAFGAGADYYITPNIVANVEWLRYNGKTKVAADKYQPHTDAFLVGLRYKFDI